MMNGFMPSTGAASGLMSGTSAPRHEVALLRPGTGKDPAAAGGLAVVRELPEAVQLLAGLAHHLLLVFGIHEVGERLSAELARDLLGRRRRLDRVIPGEIPDRVRE